MCLRSHVPIRLVRIWQRMRTGANRKSIRLWEPHLVSGRGEGRMGQAQAELLINSVIYEEPKRLTGSGQNGMWAGHGVCLSPCQRSIRPSEEREVPLLSHLAGHERGKPHALPCVAHGQDTRKSVPQAQEVKEVGESECPPVMGGIAPDGAPERGQTSDWSHFAREPAEPSKEEKQMMVVTQTTGASSNRDVLQWHNIDWARAHKTVRRLQVRIAKAARDMAAGSTSVGLC